MQGRWQKIFQGEGGQREKLPKISKKYPKIEKRPKNSKIALLSLYLLHLYHVWKSKGKDTAPLPSAADAHGPMHFTLMLFAPALKLAYYYSIRTEHNLDLQYQILKIKQGPRPSLVVPCNQFFGLNFLSWTYLERD